MKSLHTQHYAVQAAGIWAIEYAYNEVLHLLPIELYCPSNQENDHVDITLGQVFGPPRYSGRQLEHDTQPKVLVTCAHGCAPAAYAHAHPPRCSATNHAKCCAEKEGCNMEEICTCSFVLHARLLSHVQLAFAGLEASQAREAAV